MKNNTGITLIALVITIILMLILASITIKFTIGNGGIIKKAEQAKEIYEQAGKNEQEAIENIWAELKREPEEIPQPPKDTKAPTATITISGDTTQVSLPIMLSAKVKQEDEDSGIKIDSCKYIINTESEKIGLEEEKYTGGTFSSEEEIIPVKLNTTDEWYIHILTTDNSENKVETIKGPIVINEELHKHMGNSTLQGGCYTEANMQYVVIGSHKEKQGCRGTIILVDATANYSKPHGMCNKCGKEYEKDRVGEVCGAEVEVTVNDYGWVQSGWKLNCGKTEEMLENYIIIY